MSNINFLTQFGGEICSEHPQQIGKTIRKTTIFVFKFRISTSVLNLNEDMRGTAFLQSQKGETPSNHCS